MKVRHVLLTKRTLIILLMIGVVVVFGQRYLQTARAQVPSTTLNYTQDVEAWWATHPYNPATTAGNYIPVGGVQSPMPQVNVCDFKAGSDTAGIAEALAQIPLTGGTLYFPTSCSPYVMTRPLNWANNQYPATFSWVNGGVNLPIIRRNNVHFVADATGATIRGSFQITSMEWRDNKVSAAYSAVKNFYFKNLTFDYPNATTENAAYTNSKKLVFIFEDVENVLFDNVKFINGGFMSIINNNNYFIRNSSFSGGPGMSYDGAQWSGILNTTFTNNVGSPGIYSTSTIVDFHVNMDGTRDVNGNGTIDPVEQRIPRYFVFEGNNFGTGAGTNHNVLLGGVRDLLFKNNIVAGGYGRVVHVDGDTRPIPPANTVWYDYYNYKIKDNQMSNVTNYLTMNQLNKPFTMGRYTVTGNQGTGVTSMLGLTGTIDEPNVVSGNCVNGKIDGTGATCTVPNQPTPTVIVTTSTPVPSNPSVSPTPCASPVTIGSLVFTVDVATTDTYTVWSRIMGAGDAANSYWIKIDNGCPRKVGDLNGMGSGNWEWVDYTDGNTSNKLTVALPAGLHTVTLYGEERNVKVDRVILTAASCTPTGTGDNCIAVVPTATTVPTPAEVTPTLPQPGGENLLLNSSFETNNNGSPLNWATRSNTRWDTTVARTGVASMKIVSPPDPVYLYTWQAKTLKPNTSYTLEGWVKTQNFTGIGAHIRYVQTSPSTKYFSSNKVTGTIADWQKVTITFTTPTDYETGRVDLFYEMNDGSTVWFDDIALCEGTCGPTVTSVPPNTPVPTMTSTPPTSTVTPTPIVVPTPTPVTIAILPTDDAAVSSQQSTRNYGSASTLWVDGVSPVEMAFLKFDLTQFAGDTVTRAVLRIRVTGGSMGTQTIKSMNDTSWRERGITYDNRPRTGSVVTTNAGGTKDEFREIDVTAVIAARVGGLVTLSVEQGHIDGFDFASKEHNNPAYRPQLVITTN